MFACPNCGGPQDELRIEFDQPCRQCGKRFSDIHQPKTLMECFIPAIEYHKPL